MSFSRMMIYLLHLFTLFSCWAIFANAAIEKKLITIQFNKLTQTHDSRLSTEISEYFECEGYSQTGSKRSRNSPDHPQPLSL
ncbi:asr2330 [Nostoc sp. PCC 7120 = FACHB-418]|nr:asr2330 [Nostoc sp. PCC 7120 = FACHB-418]